MVGKMLFMILMAILPIAKGAIPGTFYWKPRLGIDLARPTTTETIFDAELHKERIHQGLVVMINGYHGGITVVAMAAGITSAKTNPHINPLSAYFYTNAYRWALRYISMLPLMFGSPKGNIFDTQKLWRQRFVNTDELVPKSLRNLFPYVKKEEWEKEEKELKRYKKYSESAFTKFYRFPNREFTNFASMENSEELDEAKSE